MELANLKIIDLKRAPAASGPHEDLGQGRCANDAEELHRPASARENDVVIGRGYVVIADFRSQVGKGRAACRSQIEGDRVGVRRQRDFNSATTTADALQKRCSIQNEAGGICSVVSSEDRAGRITVYAAHKIAPGKRRR